MNSKIIIGVDNGNENTKTANFVFTTGIEKFDKKPPLGNDVMKFNGRYFALVNSRSTYEQDKTVNEDTFILTLFAIAKELKHRIDRNIITKEKYYDIALSVGLPPGHFALINEKFRSYFMQNGQNITMEYNGETFHINISNVFVFPQGFAAIISQPGLLTEYEKSYLIDIGGYTTDVILLVKGIPDLSVCYSINAGMILMNQAISNAVQAKFGLDIEASHISSVLQGKKHVLNSDVVSEIINQAEKYIVDLLKKLRERGIDLRIYPAIFVGGGSLLAKNLIENSKDKSIVKFVEDIQANAKGYEYAAKLKLNN